METAASLRKFLWHEMWLFFVMLGVVVVVGGGFCYHDTDKVRNTFLEEMLDFF